MSDDTTTDELFNEASTELQTDIIDALSEAEGELPEADEMWDVDGDNVLGVMNTLTQSLDTGDADASYTEARKWFVLAKEADALDDQVESDIESRLDTIQTTLQDIQTILDVVDDITPLLPSVHDSLEDLDKEPADTLVSEVAESGSDDTSMEDEETEGEDGSEDESDEDMSGESDDTTSTTAETSESTESEDTDAGSDESDSDSGDDVGETSGVDSWGS